MRRPILTKNRTAGGSGGAQNTSNIKVVARFRPQNKTELAHGGEPIVKFLDNETCSITSSANAPFAFDRVFDMSSTQADIFNFSIRTTVQDVMNGYNGTVFAYGQTGAGKSYTMMGDANSETSKGIIPRIAEQIFDYIQQDASPTTTFVVGVSYMEIYMEKIRDLLKPTSINLPIHDSAKGPYVKDLTQIYVDEVSQVYQAMELGSMARVTASTNMNEESSRSHSIFVLSIQQKDTITGTEKTGMLYLVDLAGSEKVNKTDAKGQRLEEAKKINTSLTSLGMVINALTDGKSTHVPYRDSKLTRILQESLGGNSRTTLVINCSPSNYNEQETVGTLRFGMRAKSIKNKAKINAELSPAELKRQLNVARNQSITFEKYIASLDGEVQLWRRGETVPKEQWVPSLSSGKTNTLEARPRPGTPSRSQTDLLRSETPARPDSRTGDRSSTPSMILEKDEREEFIRRENELQDQLAEKETQAATAEKGLQETREELRTLREGQMRVNKENEAMADKVNKTQMELQKLLFQGKEDAIQMDSIKEVNTELESELLDMKQQLLNLKMSAKERNAESDEKERKKQDRMKSMLAGFDMAGNDSANHEQKMQSLIEEFDGIHAAATRGEPIEPEALADLRSKLLQSHSFVRQAESHVSERSELAEIQDHARVELQERYTALEMEYEEMLSRNLGPEDAAEVKEKLAKVYIDQTAVQSSLINDLRDELTHKSDEFNKLKQSMSDMQSKGVNGVVPGMTSKSLQQQISSFDTMKKSLMRDLQNRCERVVELEISLDETREQYNNVLRVSNNRQQQKKMAFLERNLEQLTVVQRQLVEQNTSLKKEVAIAERKLQARNERINSLEALLEEAQEKISQSNHRYVVRFDDRAMLTSTRFEVQLQAVRERLEAAKISSRNQVSQPGGGGNAFSLSNVGARIAKPLTGGGGHNMSNGGANPAFSNLQSEPNGKRTSWFFNAR
jgi:kinesin family protein 5